jgi:hypothetical protein
MERVKRATLDCGYPMKSACEARIFRVIIEVDAIEATVAAAHDACGHLWQMLADEG